MRHTHLASLANTWLAMEFQLLSNTVNLNSYTSNIIDHVLIPFSYKNPEVMKVSLCVFVQQVASGGSGM